jgi:hypothetical protein
MGRPILRERGKRVARRRSEVQLMRLLQERLARLMAPGGDSDWPVHEALVEVSRKLKRPGWSAYLVGGTLRDLLVGPDNRHVAAQPRDVDIIVCGASREQLLELLKETLVLERLTRFGGLHLVKQLPSGSRVVFDIWTLADTWGFQSQKITPRIEDFPGTTFLNIDSCAIELLQPAGRPRALFAQGFFEGITNRVLDVIYAPNPYPYVCVARALVMAARLDFTITRALAEFILSHGAAGGVDALIEAQQSHYGMVRSDARELGDWLDQIRRQFDAGSEKIRLAVSTARRLQLWQDYPATDVSGDQASPNQRLIPV